MSGALDEALAKARREFPRTLERHFATGILEAIAATRSRRPVWRDLLVAGAVAVMSAMAVARFGPSAHSHRDRPRMNLFSRAGAEPWSATP